MAKIVRLVGAPACGKTHLSRILVAELGIPCYGIADERLVYGWSDRAWYSLAEKVAAQPACMVETSGNNPRDAWLCAELDTYTILMVASQADRKRRLQARVDDGSADQLGLDDYVKRLLALQPPRIQPQALLSTSGDRLDLHRLALVLDEVRRFIEAGPG